MKILDEFKRSYGDFIASFKVFNIENLKAVKYDNHDFSIKRIESSYVVKYVKNNTLIYVLLDYKQNQTMDFQCLYNDIEDLFLKY